jgi:hypothetical protein
MVGVKMMTKVVSNVSLLQLQLMLKVRQKTQSPHNPKRQPQQRPIRRHLKTTHHQLWKRLPPPKNNLRQQAMENQKVLHHRLSKTVLQSRFLRLKTTQRRFPSNLKLLQSKPRLRKLLNKKRPMRTMMPRSKTMLNQWTIRQLRQRLNQMRKLRSKKMLQRLSRLKP